MVAARHERQRQSFRRVRRAHGQRRRGRPRRRARTSRCSATPAAAAPARRSRHYSRLARELHPELPQELTHLAWLDLVDGGRPGILGGDGADGPVRRGEPRADSPHIARALGVEVMLDLENHHNFAWRERHRLPDGSDATSSSTARARRRPAPACSGSFPARWARRATSSAARACAASLNSASHGAGPAHEPHEGEGDVHVGRRAASSCASAA